MFYLTVSLLDEVTTFLQVTEQIHVWMILNTDGLVDEELREDIFHPEGHVEDVGNLKTKQEPSHQQKNMCFKQVGAGERQPLTLCFLKIPKSCAAS